MVRSSSSCPLSVCQLRSVGGIQSTPNILVTQEENSWSIPRGSSLYGVDVHTSHYLIFICLPISLLIDKELARRLYLQLLLPLNSLTPAQNILILLVKSEKVCGLSLVAKKVLHAQLRPITQFTRASERFGLVFAKFVNIYSSLQPDRT